MAGPGLDGQIVLDDGRVLEYWDGGDPAGKPVIYHPGTPVTRVLGQWGHQVAVDAGVRLIALNRPGYGGSTSIRAPSLASVGRDTVALARQLGIDEFAVFGASGGGPYAVATELASEGAVRALGVVGGVGPWRELEAADYGAEDRLCLAMLDAGDLSGARECLGSEVRNDRLHMSPLEFFEAVAAGEPSALLVDEAYRALWIENCQAVLDQPDGYTDDNVAWGGSWDIDPRGVTAPTYLLYGTADTRCSHDGHGTWYAERIAGSELVELQDEVHFDVIDGHWPEVLAALLRIWA
jgi:pimeloyl-ACP methyl ester carboxylesterase